MAVGRMKDRDNGVTVDLKHGCPRSEPGPSGAGHGVGAPLLVGRGRNTTSLGRKPATSREASRFGQRWLGLFPESPAPGCRQGQRSSLGGSRSAFAAAGRGSSLPDCKGHSSCRAETLMSRSLQREQGNQLSLLLRGNDGALGNPRATPIISTRVGLSRAESPGARRGTFWRERPLRVVCPWQRGGRRQHRASSPSLKWFRVSFWK